MLFFITPCHAIVKNSNDDEKNIKAGENNEKKVERVPHLLGGEDEDDEDVPQDSQTPNTHLKITNFKPFEKLLWKYQPGGTRL